MTEHIDVKETTLSSNQQYVKNLYTQVIGKNSRDGDVFTMQFFNIELGQRITTGNISVEGCTFVKNEILHKDIDGYKIYKDTVTGNEVRMHVYMSPSVSHSDDDNFLNDYTYFKNSTNTDRLVLEMPVVQNNVDLTGRHITFVNEVDVSGSGYVDFITTYNKFTQTHTAKMFRTFDGYVPVVLQTKSYYKIEISVTNMNPQDYAGLNRGFFNDIYPINVSSADNSSTINVTERIDFIDDDYNVISCDLNMDACHKDMQTYRFRNTVFDSWCTPSNLFIDREYPRSINGYVFGSLQQTGWGIDKMSLADGNTLNYTLTFLSSINKECIKGFNVTLGPVNDGVLFNSYDCKASFRLYDAFSNVLLYEIEIVSDNNTVITPFKDY